MLIQKNAPVDLERYKVTEDILLAKHFIRDYSSLRENRIFSATEVSETKF